MASGLKNAFIKGKTMISQRGVQEENILFMQNTCPCSTAIIIFKSSEEDCIVFFILKIVSNRISFLDRPVTLCKRWAGGGAGGWAGCTAPDRPSSAAGHPDPGWSERPGRQRRPGPPSETARCWSGSEREKKFICKQIKHDL